MKSFTPHPTPNPNSVKVTTTGATFIPGGMETYASLEEAASSPVASALFEIPGVLNVFVVPDFVTITKRPDTTWDDVWPAARQALERTVGG